MREGDDDRRGSRSRADALLVERGLCESREKARRLILAGAVYAGERRVAKPGERLGDDAPLRVEQPLRYVSRGGVKLAHALAEFRYDPAGQVALDVGASTGGFTDCLLQHGAQRVYALDVGYGQLAWKLRTDPRVVVLERTNVRYVTPAMIPEPLDLVTIDVAFISLSKVFPAVIGLMRPRGAVIALVKPQFEAGPERVGKGGIVRDPAVHLDVIAGVLDAALGCGLVPRGLVPSPVLGAAGNVEFLAWFERGAAGRGEEIDAAAWRERAAACVAQAAEKQVTGSSGRRL